MTTKQRLAWRSLTLSKILCLSGAIFPLLSAAGWIFHIDLLKQFRASLPPMQPNTAVGLILASISIYFTRHRDSRKSSAVAIIAAAFISLQGCVTLGEYIFGMDFGIDQILMEVEAHAGHSFPGRPSPQTAATLAILGAGLLIYNIGPFRARIGQACALLAGGNAIIAMTGYLFGTQEFYGFPPFSPDIGMAVSSSASFVLLALALLCSRPDDGMMSLVVSDTRSGGMARKLIWAGSLVIPLAGILTRLGVLAGWYNDSFQVVLFIVVILVIMLGTTWQAARHSEEDELRGRAAFSETQRVNENLKKAMDENARLLRETQFAVKTRDEVLSVVSHDLKTPLATISILIQIVRRSGQLDAEKLKDFTNKIQRSVQDMDSLISDLLDFGKIQSGTFSLALQQEKLEPILLGAIDSVRVLAEVKRQTLRFDVSYGNLRPIAVDSRRIGQVMANLLGNAVKFGPEGGMIQVSARQQENEIVVSVADDGPGISREHLPRIFDRFWQAEENKFLGSGLGLSIARGIVQAHGGKMWAEGRTDKLGSLFCFSLPTERAGAASKNTVA